MSWYHQGLRGAKFPRRFCSWCWRSFCWRRCSGGLEGLLLWEFDHHALTGLLSIEDMGIYSWWWWWWLLWYHYYHHSHYGDIRSFKTPVGEKTLQNSGWWDPSALGPSSQKETWDEVERNWGCSWGEQRLSITTEINSIWDIKGYKWINPYQYGYRTTEIWNCTPSTPCLGNGPIYQPLVDFGLESRETLFRFPIMIWTDCPPVI